MYYEKPSKPKFETLGLYFNRANCKIKRGSLLTDVKANPEAWSLINMN